jgi:hypothetical protein
MRGLGVSAPDGVVGGAATGSYSVSLRRCTPVRWKREGRGGVAHRRVATLAVMPTVIQRRKSPG